MGKTDDIIRLMQHLQNNGIKVTNDFVDDIKKLTEKQKELLEGNLLWRYEYRDNSWKIGSLRRDVYED